MINNDYVRGYFDAHGNVDKPKPIISPHLFRIRFYDRFQDQLKRVENYLATQGYHPCYRLDHTHQNGKLSFTYELSLNRQAEIRRFAEEIGSERPEWQERLALINR